MGYQQAIRGNPEVKQYWLVNDFSGGINNVDVDERTPDNQFRELVNVELSKQGLLQNRKGWGLAKRLNEMFEYHNLMADLPLDQRQVGSVTILNKVVLMQIVKNTGNLLRELENYASYEAYLATNPTFNFELLVGYVGTSSTSSYSWFGLITFAIEVVNGGTVLETTFNFAEDVEFLLGVFSPLDFDKIVNIETVEHNDKVYIPLNSFSSGYGFLIYDINEATLSIMNKDSVNFYVPNPYEIKNVGFNVLLNDPTMASGINAGITNIYSAYLTDLNDCPVKFIPSDGNFKLNVYFSGIVDWTKWKVEAYTEKDTGSSIEKTIIDSEVSSPTVVGNKATFTIKLSIANIGGAFIRLYQETPYAVSLTKTTLADLLADFEAYSVGEMIAIKEVTGSTEDTSIYRIYQYAGRYNWQHSTYFIGAIKGLSTTSYTTPDVDMLNSLPAENRYFYYVTLNKILWWDEGSSSFIDGAHEPDYPAIPFSDLPKIMPVLGAYYSVTSDGALTGTYSWVGTYTGTASDFLLQTTTTTIDYEYIVEYFVGTNTNVKPVQSLFSYNLGNMRMLEMKDRLVIYFGNTIWWSDLFNFTYFPYYNYVNLSLSADDAIQSINYFRGSYIVFTKERIYRISGTFGQEDFQVVLINDAIGCYAAYSVRSINNYLYFLSQDGIYRLRQNYYIDGLENVEKVDNMVSGLYKIDSKVESILYKEQCWWLLPNEDYDTLKLYYNIGKENPYTVDKYAIKPTNLSKFDFEIYSLRNGLFYKYDSSYEDFLPTDTPTESQLRASLYETSFITTGLSMGYPTHEKKFKTLVVKTNTFSYIPLKISIIVDGFEKITSTKLRPVIDQETGSVSYEYFEDVNHEIEPSALLGEFIVGDDRLGIIANQLHKVSLGFKGRNVTLKVVYGGYVDGLDITKQGNHYIGFLDVGYVFKLGKIREDK